MRWSKFKDCFSIWASRTPERALVKFTRVNPVYPFDRRAAGVYVFNKLHANHLTTATFLLLAAGAYLASLGADSSNFSRLDSIFFPCIALIIGILIIWRNAWTYSIVLNYPSFRYEYYIGEQIIAVGPIVDVYIRMKVMFAGEEDMFYKIVVGATNIPELDMTKLSESGNLYRTIAKKLAETLNLNYFDIMDLSHLHECRHPTTRHLNTFVKRKSDMSSLMKEEVQQDYLIKKLDRFWNCKQTLLDVQENLPEEPNWPFLRLKDLNLGVPLESVRRIKKEKKATETWAWRMRKIIKMTRDCFKTIKVGIIGFVPVEPATTLPAGRDDKMKLKPMLSQCSMRRSSVEELDDKEKSQLIEELDEVECDIKLRRRTQSLLKLRTGTCCKRDRLSVDQMMMMQLVARFMALRNHLRVKGESIPGISEDFSFLGLYTARKEYPEYYESAVTELESPRRKSWWACISPRLTHQVHPSSNSPAHMVGLRKNRREVPSETKITIANQLPEETSLLRPVTNTGTKDQTITNVSPTPQTVSSESNAEFEQPGISLIPLFTDTSQMSIESEVHRTNDPGIRSDELQEIIVSELPR